AIDGTGGLTKQGTGTLTLGGTNGFSGGLVVNGGAVSVSADGALGATAGGITLNGATLQATASFTSSNRATTLSAGGGTFNLLTGATVGWTGAIDGSGALTKTG